jgi:hypothetical protein
MFYVEEICPYCEVGEIGFRRCDDGVTLVLMCDECNFVWFDPKRIKLGEAVLPDMATSKVPGTMYSVGGGAADWATRAEIEAAGWQAFIFGETPINE